MEIAEQLATYLSNNNIGSYTPDDVTGNIFIDNLPETTDCIAIFNTSGTSSDLLDYSVAGIQIYYRGNTNPIESYKQANKIFHMLHRKHGKLVESHIVDCYSPTSSAMHIGKDSNENHEYSMNFQISYLRED